MNKIILLLTTFIISINSQALELTAAIFDIAPWGYKSDSGKIAGIEYEIIKAIEKEIDEPINIRLQPYKRMMSSLEKGEVDFSIFFRSKKSEKVGEPLVRWGSLDIIILPKSGVYIKNYNQMRSKLIGVRLGGHFNEKFDKDNSIRKATCRDYTDCIEKLSAGRLDAVVGTAATLNYEIKKQNLDVSRFGNPYYLGVKEDWLHFSRLSKNKHKKDKIKKAVEKLVNDGTLNTIFSKYLPKKWQHQ